MDGEGGKGKIDVSSLFRMGALPPALSLFCSHIGLVIKVRGFKEVF